jgi:ATPase subunit of ABC transporter with duplicated ATPase domains
MRLLLAAIALLTLITGVQTWRANSWKKNFDVLQVQYQSEKAEAKAKYEAADKAYRELEHAHLAKLKDISNDAQAQIDKAQLDASNARKSSRRLLDAFSNSSPCAKATPGTATASASAPAAEAGDLQTIMFRRIDEAAGIIGEFADRVSIAGEACERAYEVAR